MSEYFVEGIKGFVEDVHVYDLDESIRASKYPMSYDINKLNGLVTKTTEKLASAKIGSGHDNFLNGVLVAFDLTFTNKAWVEAERYHFFDFVSSQSTMHCITKFNIPEQCDSHVDKDILNILQDKVDFYNDLKDSGEGTEEEEADAYLDVLMNVPAGFKLTARMTTNYRQLKTICSQRHNHRLPEWRAFCKWMDNSLPYFREFIGLGEEN